MAAPKGRESPEPKQSVRRIKSSAPGQLLGYGLQTTVLTHRLLTAPQGSSLSLEVIEDVAVHSEGSKSHLVQTKSALTENPVADRASSLWKTLNNWLTLILDHKVKATDTTFELYISRPVSGKLVQLFAEAKDEDSAKSALSVAREELWGEEPTYPKRKALAVDLAKHVNPVLEVAPDLLVPLIVNFRFECGSGSPHTDLLEQLRQQVSIDASNIDSAANQALGWVKRKLETRLEQHLPAVVSRDEFYAEMKAFLRRIDQQRILLSLAPSPTAEEAKLQRPSTYVRQLELIELEDHRILGAISDFLKAATDRAEWGRRGLVHRSSFDDLNNTLRSTWDNLKLISEAQFPEDESIRHGRNLFGTCMNHQAPVEGMTAPDHFLRGCFHRLADGKTIGWHPEFDKLLTSSKGKLK